MHLARCGAAQAHERGSQFCMLCWPCGPLRNNRGSDDLSVSEAIRNSDVTELMRTIGGCGSDNSVVRRLRIHGSKTTLLGATISAGLSVRMPGSEPSTALIIALTGLQTSDCSHSQSDLSDRRIKKRLSERPFGIAVR